MVIPSYSQCDTSVMLTNFSPRSLNLSHSFSPL